MGYNTTYSLSVEPPIPEEIIGPHIEEGYFYRFEDLNLEEGILGSGYCTWYEHEEELRELSKQFPDHLFTLWGNGDNSEDLWYKYFQDGKMQHCPASITFDEYDPVKMV